jgi:SAM-dependent methyltransferase
MGDTNILYYNKNPRKFSQETLSLDMEVAYSPFLSELSPRGSILDVGCGSGRDSLYFKNLGFAVVSMDPARALAELAEKELGLKVQIGRVQDLDNVEDFDGIWACASLLHVSHAEMLLVFQKLAKALKPKGVLYCSYKYGEGEVEKGGRRFSNFNETDFKSFIKTTKLFETKQLWKTTDQRPNRGREQWLNALVTKK